MKFNLFLYAALACFQLWGQEKVELDKLPEIEEWSIQLLPFNDGSYAITSYSWDTYNTTFYSADHKILNSGNSVKKDWRFANKMGITGTNKLINESMVDPETKNGFTVKASFKNLTFTVVNPKFEVQTFEQAIDLDGFTSQMDKAKFVNEAGVAYFLFWQNEMEANGKRKIVVASFDQNTKKFTLKMNELTGITATYFDFIGFLNGEAVLAGMKQGTVQSELTLNLFNLEGADIIPSKTMNIKLEEEIRPEYICGIYNDDLTADYLTFAIGISQMDGKIKQIGSGYKFIKMYAASNYTEVNWMLEGMKVEGKVPMASIWDANGIENIILKGSFLGIALDVDYTSKSISNLQELQASISLENFGYWTYFMTKETLPKPVVDQVEKIVHPSSSPNGPAVEHPCFAVLKDGTAIIAWAYGKQNKHLDIYRIKP